MINDKIKSLAELAEICKELRKQGKVVVTTNGSYDVVHAGHVRSLQESKEQGDILMVGINSNKSVKSYKSHKRPIVSEEYRVELVAGLTSVDYVFLFSEDNPIEFIKKLKPDVHTNGIDWGEDCIERRTIEENGGRLHILKKHEGISSSGIIEKILSIYCEKRK